MTDPSPAPGLLRRLGAILYDSLILAALFMVATAFVLPLTRGDAIPSGAWHYRLYLLVVAFIYLAGCWTLGGQTVGMRTWKFRVVRSDGSALSWADATRRFGAAILSWMALGLGYLWVLFDPDRLAWHDRLSHTQLVIVHK